MPPACMRRVVFLPSREIAFVLNFTNARLSIPAPSALIGALFIAPTVFLTFIFLPGIRYLIEIWPRSAGSGATAGQISIADGAEEQATGPSIAINQTDQMTRQISAMIEESRPRAGASRAA
jgi:hypothetical protein